MARKQVSQNLQFQKRDTLALIAALQPMIEEWGATINALILQSTPVTPAALAANTNDYVVSENGIQRISASVAVNLTGIAGGEDGRLLVLINVGANAISVTNQDALSVAVNRIITSTAGTIVMATNGTMMLLYDAASSRWRQI